MHETSRILIVIKIPAADEITSDAIAIRPARPLASISENELNRHLRHLQPWNYTTSLFLAPPRQLSRAFNTHTRVTDIARRCACAPANEYVKDCYYLSQYTSWARNTRSRGRLNHSRTRSEVRRRRNCLTVGGRRGRRRRRRQGERIHNVVHYQFVPSCCRNGPLFVTRFQSDKYVLHVAL